MPSLELGSRVKGGCRAGVGREAGKAPVLEEIFLLSKVYGILYQCTKATTLVFTHSLVPLMQPQKFVSSGTCFAHSRACFLHAFTSIPHNPHHISRSIPVRLLHGGSNQSQLNAVSGLGASPTLSLQHSQATTP